MTFGLEGISTDADRNALLGKTLSRFGIAGPTPTPTPTATATETATSTPEPTATATATPTATPPAAGQGKLKIGRGPLRAAKNRTVPVRIKCVKTDERCTGSVKLVRKGKTIGSKPFSVPPRVKRIRNVRIDKATYKLLRKRGKLKVKAVATGTSGGYALLRAVQKITVRAPR